MTGYTVGDRVGNGPLRWVWVWDAELARESVAEMIKPLIDQMEKTGVGVWVEPGHPAAYGYVFIATQKES